MALLEVNGLSAGYGERQILREVTFRVESHSVVGLLGTNGSGKTTLLKALCGITPSRGSIRLLGSDARRLSPRELAQRSRYIPQHTGLTIDLSVLDAVLMGFNPQLGLLEYPSRAMQAAAIRALGLVGLADRADHNFQTLSEGQKQLCILARTLLLEKGVLFLDEPESALDFSGRYRILELVRSWADAHEGAALVTLHDPQLALNTCDRLLLLRDGCICADLVPGRDSTRTMEEALCGSFGSLSIHCCSRRDGKNQFVLLKE